jgi:hypothetical protein
MGTVAATSLPMAFYRPVLFLAMVAVFSLYAAFSGYRVLKLKDLPYGGYAKAINWIAAIITFANSGLLALHAWLSPATVQHMGIVAIVFGFLGMNLAGRQMWTFIFKHKEKMFWWYTHLGNFIGSYIAAWTAFSVVTLPTIFGQHYWLWLWPTAIGVPAITITTIYYKRMFAPKVQPPAVAEPA